MDTHPALFPQSEKQHNRCQAKSFKGKGCGHVGSNGSQVANRAQAQGYQFGTIAENVAVGHESVPEVMEAWMNSPGHRANILRAEVTEIGAARVGNSWVQVFGRPMSATEPNS